MKISLELSTEEIIVPLLIMCITVFLLSLVIAVNGPDFLHNDCATHVEKNILGLPAEALQP